MAKQQTAFNALIADLLERDPQDNGGWLYRSLSANRFSGEAIGYRPFMAVLRPMMGLMIDFVGGTRQYTQNDLTGGSRERTWDRAARFRATDWLRDWFAAEGVSRDNWSEHFRRELVAASPRQASVELRYANRAGQRSWKTVRNMPFDRKDPKAVAIIERMDRLNAFLAAQTVEPFGPIFLRRIFSNGDQPGFDWDLGGRLYALGHDNFQTAKRKDRASILINGKATKEIDLRASHLTLLVGLGHVPITALEGDPYQVEGLPREVVKQWVTMTMSHDKRHKRWPPLAKREMMEKHGWDLTKDFPLIPTGDAILAKLPILGPKAEALTVSWGQLQFIESEIVLATMEELAFSHGIASLPVHDSLIVPEGDVELASSLLKDAFKASVGVKPVVT
ncbi:hypothetical protein [Aurantiacibacter odishensis]|uniref:hypothetical protein n=1 Tax=Aurantiacibacter odishensis TaxID=1155476 RepID=UPI00196AA214|nr:hypothetical protein [Aurantiacibacter odishensis]